MTFPHPTAPATPPGPGSPLRLEVAVRAHVAQLPPARRGHARVLLDALGDFLGEPAPLLAYTPLTGEQWVRSLPPGVQEGARDVLAAFRAFLRDHGWLDAARPVNVFD